MMENIYLIEMMIYFIALMVGVFGYYGYIVFWYLIMLKVETEFQTVLECEDEKGNTVLCNGYCIPRNDKFINNEWIFKMYKQHFGA